MQGHGFGTINMMSVSRPARNIAFSRVDSSERPKAGEVARSWLHRAPGVRWEGFNGQQRETNMDVCAGVSRAFPDQGGFDRGPPLGALASMALATSSSNGDHRDALRTRFGENRCKMPMDNGYTKGQVEGAF